MYFLKEAVPIWYDRPAGSKAGPSPSKEGYKSRIEKLDK
jgi:hypothetical protein